MVALDTDAAIAAFQLNPTSPLAASYRARVRRFVLDNGNQFMIPAVALAEYLTPFVDPHLTSQIKELLDRRFLPAPFDRQTAVIAADIGRRFASGKTYTTVAKEYDSDRIAYKADVLIVATAFQHNAKYLLTNDKLTQAIARFVKLDACLLSELPELPPPPPPLPPPPPRTAGEQRRHNLFDTLPPKEPNNGD